MAEIVIFIFQSLWISKEIFLSINTIAIELV